jgi:hypothetical protein
MIEWSSASFQINAISPSKNTTNWTSLKGRMQTKTKWRGLFEEEFYKLDLPRPIPRMPGTPLIVIVTIRFAQSSRGPEVINYEPCIKECVADGLRLSAAPTANGWIDDDKDDQIRLSVHIMKERAPTKEDRGMRVELRWMEPQRSPSDSPFYEADDKAVVELPSQA